MPIASYLIDPRLLAVPWAAGAQPIGVVDLDKADEQGPVWLPPFPVIGSGDRRHPLASRLDAVIEPPFSAGAIIAQVCDQPDAAAVGIQLLRLIGQLDLPSALVAESLAYGMLQGSAGHARWLAARSPAQALPPGEVRLERVGDELEITMTRPWTDNAIDRSMRDGLRQGFELAALDPGIARVRLCGAGRAFSVGADLAEFGTTRDPATTHAIRIQTLPAHALALCAPRFVAHVHGACVGAGLEMAAFAARLTASRRAWFHLPELAMGVIPGAGGCVSVTRRIGRQRTALLLLSGRRIGATTALAWGLVDALVDDPASDGGEANVISQQA